MSQQVLDAGGEALLARVPLRRFGGAEDLKGAIAFLASPASAYVTGPRWSSTAVRARADDARALVAESHEVEQGHR